MKPKLQHYIAVQADADATPIRVRASEPPANCIAGPFEHRADADAQFRFVEQYFTPADRRESAALRGRETRTFSIRLTPDEHDRLSAMAKADGITKAELVRRRCLSDTTVIQ